MNASRYQFVLASCLALTAGMVGLSYAAVPLYYMFCAATGYGGTPARADAAPGEISDRVISVRFDANVDPQLPWVFAPERQSVQVKVGEDKLVFFRAENLSQAAVVGHAAFNVAPDNAARYFTKIQCFCFTEQKLEAGQSVEMPVVFFVAPGILQDRGADNVTEITLSYTFYPAANPKTADTSSTPSKGPGG
jgi:cytochrome c oxidase assembly protein subunit 11